MTTPVEYPQLHTCPQCGDVFSLSARNSRLHRERGTRAICRGCRYPAHAVSAEERLRYRRWWLDRFSLEELRQIGAGLMLDFDLRGTESRSPTSEVSEVQPDARAA